MACPPSPVDTGLPAGACPRLDRGRAIMDEGVRRLDASSFRSDSSAAALKCLDTKYNSDFSQQRNTESRPNLWLCCNAFQKRVRNSSGIASVSAADRSRSRLRMKSALARMGVGKNHQQSPTRASGSLRWLGSAGSRAARPHLRFLLFLLQARRWPAA